MRRESHVISGYDCRERCTVPSHGETFGREYRSRGENHGQHCDEWVYVAHGDGYAMELVVFAYGAAAHFKLSPPSTDPPRGVHLIGHYPFALTAEAVREKSPGEPCKFIGASCYQRAFGGEAEFFAANGKPQFVQDERFWTALEQRAKEGFEVARSEAVGLTHVVCATCNGVGIVKFDGDDDG